MAALKCLHERREMLRMKATSETIWLAVLDLTTSECLMNWEEFKPREINCLRRPSTIRQVCQVSLNSPEPPAPCWKTLATYLRAGRHHVFNSGRESRRDANQRYFYVLALSTVKMPVCNDRRREDQCIHVTVFLISFRVAVRAVFHSIVGRLSSLNWQTAAFHPRFDFQSTEDCSSVTGLDDGLNGENSWLFRTQFLIYSCQRIKISVKPSKVAHQSVQRVTGMSA